MSLLSVNQVLALLGTDNVSVVSRVIGLQKKIVDQKHVSLNQNEVQPRDEIKSGIPVWQQTKSQLEGLLASMQIESNATLCITLASDLVRYLALPAQPIYMNHKEKLAYAAASYREVYGETVSHWEIKLQNTPAHQTTIAVAIDKDFLEALNQVAIKYKLKLVGVQPYLMSAFNSLSKQIGKTSGYLVIVELNRLLLINLNKGDCSNLRVFPLSNDWQAMLKSLMLRELMLSDTKNQEVLVYAPAHKNTIINAIEGWKISRIGSSENVISHHRFYMLEAAL